MPFDARTTGSSGRRPAGRLARILAVAAVVLLPACSSGGGGMTPVGSRQIDTNIQGDFTSPSISLELWEDVYVRHDTIAGADDPEELYRQVLAVYREMDVPMTTVNVEARLVGAVEKRVRREFAGSRVSRWLRCGSSMAGEFADRYEVYVTLLTQVEPAGERPRLLTYLRGVATQGQVSGHPVRCTSEGRLEREIFQRVQLKAAAASRS
jgi:hypothetical protein